MKHAPRSTPDISEGVRGVREIRRLQMMTDREIEHMRPDELERCGPRLGFEFVKDSGEPNYDGLGLAVCNWLREIAYQLALINERQERYEREREQDPVDRR